jgi:large subunit ribosomal protein L3
MAGLLGKKIGMTQVFSSNSVLQPVTVIEAGPCFVLKISEKSVQLAFGAVKESRVKKSLLGLFKKIKVVPCRIIKELPRDESIQYHAAQALKVDLFKPGDFVDITGVSKGKGFQGGVRRWGWRGGPKSHGSTSHRRIGSINASAYPSRVFKGRHLPGHMGNKKVTIQNLQVLKVDPDNNLMVVKGAVPGHRNSYLIIRESKKKRGASQATSSTRKT